MDPEHFHRELDSCRYCKAYVADDERPLLWECATFSEERSAALDALEPRDRPPTLGAWFRPDGKEEKKDSFGPA